MDPTDLSAGECLRILLDEQARNLRITAGRLDEVWRVGTQETKPSHWAGPARMAHDDLAERLLANLVAASRAVTTAAEHSARAVGTLAGRVG